MRRVLLLTTSALLCFGLSARPAGGLPGDLDATFAGDGKVVTSIGFARDRAHDAAIQPDGKVVVAGDSQSSGNQSDDVALVRYTTKGALDTTFSADGMVTKNITPDIGSTSEDHGNAVVIQDTGKIVVAGTAQTGLFEDDFLLVRFTATGQLDTTFGGGDGIALADVSPGDELTDLVIGPLGTLIAVGTTVGANTDVAVLRFDADGASVTTFGGGDGIVLADVSGNYETGEGVAVQGDGMIVVTGRTAAAGQDQDTVVLRFQSDGDPDATFGGGDGVVVLDLDASAIDRGEAVTLLPGNLPLVAGVSGGDLFAMKLEADGDPDPLFGGGDGVGAISFPFALDGVGGVVVQANGAILAIGGPDINVPGGDFAIARFEADGDPDVRFGGGDGAAQVNFGSDQETGTGIVRQADGKVVVAGTSKLKLPGQINSDEAFAVARIKTAAPAYRPDALIRRAGTTNWTGDDVYSATAAGQTLARTVGRGKTVTFSIPIENDGVQTDAYEVDGCGSSGSFSVKYLRGTTVITAAVANGTYTLSGMSPNERVTLTMKITIAANASVGTIKSCLVSATSHGAPAIRDAVKAIVKTGA